MRVSAILLVVLAVTACSPEPHPFAFCAMDRGRLEPEPTIIDLNNERVRGTDVSRSLHVVRSDSAAGFVSPFPLMLPTGPVAQMPTHWETNGYRFVMSGSGRGPEDWVLIQAEPLNATVTPHTRTSVLYSDAAGALSLQLSIRTPQRTITLNLVSCGTTSLRGSTLAAVDGQPR